MRNQRIESRVFGNDVKLCRRVRAGQHAQIIGNMKIQRIRAGRFQHDVVAAIPQFLHRDCQFAVDFRVALA